MHKVQTDFAPVIHHFPDNQHIAINITAAQVNTSQQVDECATFLQAFGRKSVKLVLDITEREPLNITADVQTRLTERRETGGNAITG